jgi:hypothetical protein
MSPSPRQRTRLPCPPLRCAWMIPRSMTLQLSSSWTTSTRSGMPHSEPRTIRAPTTFWTPGFRVSEPTRATTTLGDSSTLRLRLPPVSRLRMLPWWRATRPLPFVFAKIAGPAGSVPVHGWQISVDKDDGTRSNQFWVISLITVADFNNALALSHNAPTTALVADLSTGTYTTLAGLNADFGGASTTTADPSFIVADGVTPVTPGLGTPQSKCVKDALDWAHDETAKAAQAAALCEAIAMTTFAVAVALCAAATLATGWTGIGIFMGGACVMAAYTWLATASAACAAILALKLYQIAQELITKMQACGVGTAAP